MATATATAILTVVPNPSSKRATAVLLIVAMAAGSLMLWIGIPLGWLYIVSQLQESTDPDMGAYLLVIVGIAVSMIAMVKVLSILNRTYLRVTGNDGLAPVPKPWMRSMRGERGSGRQASVLDVVMITTVILAATAFGLWFFLFAGSPF